MQGIIPTLTKEIGKNLILLVDNKVTFWTFVAFLEASTNTLVTK